MLKKQIKKILAGALHILLSVPMVILLLWELCARLEIINKGYFPPPIDIFFRFFYLSLHNVTFLSDIGFSLKRLIIGTIVAVPLGTILGFIMGLNRKMNDILSPMIALTYPIPKLAILPFLMIIFGIGDASKIAIIAIGIFYLILLNVVHAIQSLPQDYFDIAVVYRIPFIKRITYLVFKGIFPDILSGCKMGIGYGLVMVVASEFIAARNGIGFFMWNAWDQFRIKDLYVALFVFSLIGLSIFIFFDWMQKRLRWRKTYASEKIFSELK